MSAFRNNSAISFKIFPSLAVCFKMERTGHFNSFAVFTAPSGAV